MNPKWKLSEKQWKIIKDFTPSKLIFSLCLCVCACVCACVCVCVCVCVFVCIKFIKSSKKHATNGKLKLLTMKGTFGLIKEI